MTRQLAPLMLCLFVAIASAETATTRPVPKIETTTNPADNTKVFMPADIIPNPEIEKIVKAFPANLVERENETEAQGEARRKSQQDWVRKNLKDIKDKVLTVNAVVMSPGLCAFRIEGMENSIVVFHIESMKGQNLKKGIHVTVQAKINNLFTQRRDDVWYLFTAKEAQVTPTTQPAK